MSSRAKLTKENKNETNIVVRSAKKPLMILTMLKAYCARELAPWDPCNDHTKQNQSNSHRIRRTNADAVSDLPSSGQKVDHAACHSSNCKTSKSTRILFDNGLATVVNNFANARPRMAYLARGHRRSVTINGNCPRIPKEKKTGCMKSTMRITTDPREPHSCKLNIG